jgi:diguanylate cyclase (GGDEF)-like protein
MSGTFKRVAKIAEKIFSATFAGLTFAQLWDLCFPGNHTALVQRRQSLLIISRARMVAAVFAVLTPLWIGIDMLVFPRDLWSALAVLRVVASFAFFMLAISYRGSDNIRAARIALMWLLAIPVLFFVVSHPLLDRFEMAGSAAAVASGYAFLPFVMVAGLSVFPITAIEGAAFSLPLLLSQFLAAMVGSHMFPFNSYLGAGWLLMLLAVVATMAGMSQLHFMMALVNQASHDVLTGTFTRRVGEELLANHYVGAVRSDAPLAIAFFDLDHFKSINDKYGHEEGDKALHSAALAMRNILRRGDLVVRWGGEEFVMIMPGTDKAGALVAVERLRGLGFGKRPDGTPLTASIGIAERISDASQDWHGLVEIADQRMYVAKKTGRDKVFMGEEAATKPQLVTV